jgi:hypothetical protein
MAELIAPNLPVSRNLHPQWAANPPTGALDQDAWPLPSSGDLIVTPSFYAQALLSTMSYNTETQVDLIKIHKSNAGRYRS